ncbi:DNA-binding protein [Halomarina litorea]|uniref:DNA-binding protein n=1 Tax=Halomarina litorea TaxID=2961595 RepID=UPI0020C291A0|nr:DNA-binding protein [Halomarina sp. BCD28]
MTNRGGLGRGPADVPVSELEVPQGETPAARCEICDVPFPTTEQLALHQGLAHEAELSEHEKAQSIRAYEEEQESLGMFRLKALFALVLLYFGFLLIYAAMT